MGLGLNFYDHKAEAMAIVTKDEKEQFLAEDVSQKVFASLATSPAIPSPSSTLVNFESPRALHTKKCQSPTIENCLR